MELNTRVIACYASAEYMKQMDNMAVPETRGKEGRDRGQFPAPSQ